ncbi:cysteine--tRNA ligase [Adhaeribacter aquaticus]|uniref:cysteine--tRNA ligase n=1 Tax=Adhaeribacter aquaticus TaxID=299567 RepID=UPI000419F499|nr:cysteine--tRNA ligase [Adhaeribacter aquaticus]
MQQQQLSLYNTLSRKKEVFEPLQPPFVGMYVCGPTVYSNVHLGNVRTFLTFDILYRYLQHLGYKVRYVRNITDVGHLENDSDEGEDKIAVKARLEQLEPMEIVQRYTNDFHEVLSQFNLLPPSIEPSATGHIIEQIKSIETLIEKGLAYESGGSVYFDVLKYNESHDYGKLSGRIIEDLQNETRELDGQAEKRNPLDFAVWKNASPEHIMRWPSPWGIGFPGWHIECTSMSTKYLGTQFDIHGGGMDLKFPHHECEIAQAVGVNGEEPVRYWMHANMLTVNGEKMSKSKGNSFLPGQLFTGDHPLLQQAYSPMTVRFFMLQAHYRSTLDFSNEALIAARKGYIKLINGLHVLDKLAYPAEAAVVPEQDAELRKLTTDCFAGLNDDLNTARTIASLFNLLKKVNSLYTGALSLANISLDTFNFVRDTYQALVLDILGLKEEKTTNQEEYVNALLIFYKEAKEAKNYARVDEIRTTFKKQGIVIKDMKTGIDWAYEE